MTANHSNHVESDNSGSHDGETSEVITDHDTRNRRIIERARVVGGTTTRKDLLARTELTREALNDRLRELAEDGYVDLIGESEHELITLTCRGEQLAGGIR